MTPLTKTEQLIVDALAKGGILSAQEIYDAIDSWASSVTTVKWHVSNIRQKLGYDAIITWRRRGFSLGSKAICPTCLRSFKEPQ